MIVPLTSDNSVTYPFYRNERISEGIHRISTVQIYGSISLGSLRVQSHSPSLRLSLSR